MPDLTHDDINGLTDLEIEMPKGPWGIVGYEIAMQESLREIQVTGRLSPRALLNALTESRVLHARQQCDIFLSRCKKTDDIKLEDLVPKSEQTDTLGDLIKELCDKYGASKSRLELVDTPYRIFNKLMFHPTSNRTTSHDYEPALNIIEPILKKIVTEIERVKDRQFDRSLKG